MSTDNLIPTKDSCVYFIEHPTRKYGVRKDRKIILRYTINKKTRKEVFGWESQGYSFKAAALKVEEYKKNAKEGCGPTALKEERERQKRETELAEKNRLEKESEELRLNLTLDAYFNGEYLTAAETDKQPDTVKSEITLYNKWVKPTMGSLKLREIKPEDFGKLKRKVLKGDRIVDPVTGDVYFKPKSPRTLHYCVSIVTQVWNLACDNGKINVRPPKREFLKLPMIDNEKTRAFTPKQVKDLFAKLKEKSEQVHDIAQVSLYAGLRASEVFKLKVEDFDSKKGEIFLRSPKKQSSQTLVLNDKTVEILNQLKEEHKTGNGLFFKSRNGEQIQEVSDTVERTIFELGFNAGVTDRRDKLTFHSLRHTFATWIRDYGKADIFTISKLLRHSRLSMTLKYVHSDEEKMRGESQAMCGVVEGVKDEDNDAK